MTCWGAIDVAKDSLAVRLLRDVPVGVGACSVRDRFLAGANHSQSACLKLMYNPTHPSASKPMIRK